MLQIIERLTNKTPMTREEIKQIVRNENQTLTFNAYSKAFNREIPQSIHVPILNWETNEIEQNMDKLVTQYVTDCINDFLNLEASKFLEDLKIKIFEIFEILIEATSYGQVPNDLVEKYGNTEANRIFFNGKDKDSVYKSCNFKEVFYQQDSEPDLFYLIFVHVDWENEHGLILSFNNGKFIEIE